MPRITVNSTFPGQSIELEYESFGAPGAPTVLLIMGLGAQLTRWNIELCDLLVARGYRAIRFDNRDCGLSTHCDALPLPDIAAVLRGQPISALSALPYTLDTMAADSIALLDALGVEQAHIAGASMGASIAQIIAASFPQRTLSLTSIMSSSGNPLLPPPTPAATMALFAPLPARQDRDSIVDDGIARYRAIASPGYPASHEELKQMFGREYDRSYYPQGVARQLGAILANGDQRSRLNRIGCPTVVLHGKDDPLIQLACGEDVARNIAHAEMRAIAGMGHDFPVALTDVFADAICAAAGRAAIKR